MFFYGFFLLFPLRSLYVWDVNNLNSVVSRETLLNHSNIIYGIESTTATTFPPSVGDSSLSPTAFITCSQVRSICTHFWRFLYHCSYTVCEFIVHCSGLMYLKLNLEFTIYPSGRYDKNLGSGI